MPSTNNDSFFIQSLNIYFFLSIAHETGYDFCTVVNTSSDTRCLWSHFQLQKDRFQYFAIRYDLL